MTRSYTIATDRSDTEKLFGAVLMPSPTLSMHLSPRLLQPIYICLATLKQVSRPSRQLAPIPEHFDELNIKEQCLVDHTPVLQHKVECALALRTARAQHVRKEVATCLDVLCTPSRLQNPERMLAQHTV